MATGYTRQSTAGIVDGQTITASLFNNEFNAIVNAFHANTGHTHDGTTGGGAGINALVADAITFGTGEETDVVLTFFAASNSGLLSWMEDEDYFKFSDDILIDTTEKLQFRDTDIYLNSSADGHLDLVADATVAVTAPATTISGTLDVTGASTLTGNVNIGGTLGVTGASTLTGNVNIGGTLAVTGASTLTGDVSASGTLAVTGASTLTGNVSTSGTLGVTGASTLTGNVNIGGTLDVTGASTLTGNVSASGTLDVTGAVSGSGYTLTPTSWNSLSIGTNVTELSNSTYSSIAADYNDPEYRKVGDMVQLRGRLVSTANNAAHHVIATLPSNYRPLKNFEAVITYIDFSGTGEFLIMVKSNGDIIVRDVFDGSTMLSFDNVSFSIT